MASALLDIYQHALRVIADAGGIEGDVLRPIACPFDPAVPADRLGLAMIAAALHERQRRGYAAVWESAKRDALVAIGFPEGAQTSAAIVSRGDPFLLLRLERAHADRDVMITGYAARIAAQVGEAARQPITYVLTELTANIWDHAETEFGFVLADVGNDRIVLAVIDAGISIPFTYARRDIAFPDDVTAVRAALEGTSARPQGGRGYGIRTSAAIATRGWGGALLLASRHATVLRAVDGETARDTSPLHWNGTVVAIEVPLPLRMIDLYAYVEG